MATPTRRRTARINAQPDAKPKQKTKPVYEGVVLARVTHKVTGAFLGYLAKPSKPLDEKRKVKPWYRITRDDFGFWHCNCEATGDCKHRDAVVAVEAIHDAEQSAAAQADETPAVKTTQPAAEQSTPADLPVPVSIEERRQAKAAHRIVHCACGHDRVVGPVFTKEELEVMATQKCSECSAIKEVVVLPGKPVQPAHRNDPPKGELHSVQHRGGFVAALFGTSPDMAKYRDEYVMRATVGK